MTQPSEQPKTTTTTEIVEEIEKRAGIEFGSVGLPSHCMWFPPPRTAEDAYPRPMMLVVGEPFPLQPSFTVAFLFQDETSIRAYVAPNAADPKKPEWLRCYTLSTAAPIYFCEKMAAEAFIQAVSDEWVVKAEGQSSAERERELVLEYLDGFDALAFTGVAALEQVHAGIEAGDHLGEDEEDEPEATEPEVVAAPGAPTEPSPPLPPPPATPAAE